MDDLLVAIRVVLAAVFVVSAVAKASDRTGTQVSARALGVPDGAARYVPIALPAVEVALAVALVPVSSAPWAAAGVVLLLAAFTALVAGNLARGRRPSCHCFGALDAEPIGPWTLVRNLVLLGGATVVAAAGLRPQADVYAGAPWVEMLAGLGLGLLVWRLGRGAPSATDGPAALAVGDPVPDLRLQTLDGGAVRLSAARSGEHPTVIVFGNTGCGSCTSLLPDIERWQHEHADSLKVLPVLWTTPERAAAARGEREIDLLVLEDERSLTERFGRLAMPSALVVGPDGRVSAAAISGPDEIRDLVNGLAGRRFTSYRPSEAARSAVGARPLTSVGDPLPDVRLPSALGPAISVHETSGPVVYVFVQAQTDPSDALLRELAGEHDLAPHVVVSAGGTLGLAAELIPSPVAVDRLGLLPTALGIEALPSAVVVEEQVVTSPVAVGVEEVLDLLRAWEPVGIDADAITDDFVPRPHPATATLAVDGVTVVGDPLTGQLHTLDGPGSLIWACFDGTAPLRSIAAEISEAVGAPLEVVRRDVREFARQLGAAGVLAGVRVSAPAPAKT